ncbi:MAG: hypothetical protein HKO54_07525 [Flavobacteriaceae bacterium]|nr:hypothetical protein [Flavobacteriaceae bacterium]
MKNSTSRRLFLRKSAIATTGLTLFSTSVINALNKEVPFEGYNPFAEEKNDLRSNPFGDHVRVKGVIYDETGTTPVANAKVEVWHLSPNSKKYRHRAKFTTNDRGEYTFITDFPDREAGKTPRILFKVSNAYSSSFRELYLDRSGGYITSDHWEKNQQLGENLFPTSHRIFNSLEIQFNLTLTNQ